MIKKFVYFSAAVSAAILVVCIVALPSLSQTTRPRTVNAQPLTKKNSMVVASKSSNPVPLPPAEQNAFLRSNLEWLFGGKQQHGWYLYTALVNKLIGTNAVSNTPEFSLALTKWQRSVALPPTGVLDSDSLYKMVETWQSIRSKDHTYPAPDELITAPPSEFLYPERPEELRQVRKDAYAAYKRMLAAAIADKSLNLKAHDGELAPEERFFKLVSTFRSREYQEKLRRASPNAGTAGLALNSPHFTGRALDMYVGGDPVDTGDGNRFIQVNTPVYKWLVKNAEKFGFYPYYYEPWHWEYKPPFSSTQTASR